MDSSCASATGKTMTEISDDAPLYRYYDLPSFLYLMASRRLRLSKISKWPDKFEGTSYKFSSRVYRHNELSCDCFWGSCWTQDVDVRECHRNNESYNRANAELKENGSAAMWGSYCGGCGVRVMSTFGKIKSIIEDFAGTEKVNFEYGPIEYSSVLRIREERFRSLFHKRTPFRHESEYRFIVVDEGLKLERVEISIGNPFDFFDEMLVSPTTKTNEWLTDVVYQSVVASVGLGGGAKNGKAFVKKSQLYSLASHEVNGSFMRFNTASEAYREFENKHKGWSPSE